MSSTLWLLAIQGGLGAFDTLWFHEWRARLPVRAEVRPELALHAGRSIIYAIVFCSLPWFAWTGVAGWALAALLLAEAVITFTDFVVEDRVRTRLGGVVAGERVLHGLMAVVYGAFLAGFVPTLLGWTTGSGDALGARAPVAVLVALTALGAGSLLSGGRDALCALGVRFAAWPWRAPATADVPATSQPSAPAPPPAAAPVTPADLRPAALVATLTAVAVVATVTRPRPRPR